jgi:hypothetical protein
MGGWGPMGCEGGVRRGGRVGSAYARTLLADTRPVRPSSSILTRDHSGLDSTLMKTHVSSGLTVSEPGYLSFAFCALRTRMRFAGAAPPTDVSPPADVPACAARASATRVACSSRSYARLSALYCCSHPLASDAHASRSCLSGL